MVTLRVRYRRIRPITASKALDLYEYPARSAEPRTS
jgi:hypothetical protein